MGNGALGLGRTGGRVQCVSVPVCQCQCASVPVCQCASVPVVSPFSLPRHIGNGRDLGLYSVGGLTETLGVSIPWPIQGKDQRQRGNGEMMGHDVCQDSQEHWRSGQFPVGSSHWDVRTGDCTGKGRRQRQHGFGRRAAPPELAPAGLLGRISKHINSDVRERSRLRVPN